MVDERSGGYDAFISYNWEYTRSAARALESGLGQIWKRSGLEPELRLFRDESEQRFGQLSATLTNNLLRSRYLIVLLHRGSRDSEWMNFEIGEWLKHGGHPDRMVLVRADPSLDLSWVGGPGGVGGSFSDLDALPTVVTTAYKELPLYVNLTRSRTGRVLDPSFELARLCATVMGAEPADVLQNELRLQRRRQRRALALVLVFALLAVAAVGASVVALRSRAVAQQQRTEAEAQALAAEAMLGSTTRPDSSIHLLEDAAAKSDDKAVRLATYSVLNANPQLAQVITTGPLGGTPDDLAFDPLGDALIAWRTLPGGRGSRVAVWDFDSHRLEARGTVPGGSIERTSFLDPRTLALCRSDGGSVLTWSVPSGTSRSVAPGAIRVRTVARDQDACQLLPMVLGATLVNRKGSAATATVVGTRGRLTRSRPITSALGDSDSDRVILDPAAGPWLVASGSGRVQQVAGTANFNIDDALGGGHSGVLLIRAEGLGIVAVDPFHPGAGAQPVPLPPDVSWAVPLPNDSTEYVWVDQSGTVGWSLNNQRLDLAGRTAPRVAPKLWVLADEKIVVDNFDRAVGLKVLGDGKNRRLKQTGDMEVDTIFSSRSGTAPSLHVGRDGVFFPRGEGDAYAYFDGKDSTQVTGFPFFDDKGSAAAILGAGQVSVLKPGSGDEAVLALDQSGSAEAAAISPDGGSVAVARVGGSITVYRTDPNSSAGNLVASDAGRWTSPSTYSGTSFHAQDGSDVVFDSAGGARVTYPSIQGQVTGLFATAPGGREAVVSLQGKQGLGEDARAAVVGADRTVHQLASDECIPGNGRFTYLPGTDFRTDANAARRAVLVQSDDADATPRACDGGDTSDLAAVDEILEYGMRGQRGQILARDPTSGTLQAVTWAGTTTPEVRPLPDTGRGWQGTLATDGLDALVWNTGTGTLTWLTRTTGAWTLHRSAHFQLEDIVAGFLRPDEGIAVMVGSKGGVQVIDFASGRVVLATSVTAGFAQEVVSAKLDYVDGAFQLTANGGRPGLVTVSAVRMTLPWRMDLLRDALCSIAPRTSPTC